MTGMQDVIAAVGEDDGFAGTSPIAAALRPVLRVYKRHPFAFDTVPIIEGEFRRILVRATNWVGDAVMSLPCPASLARAIFRSPTSPCWLGPGSRMSMPVRVSRTK